MSTHGAGTQRALGAKCSQCGHPFRDHKSHIDPALRGGLRFSMTCSSPSNAAPRTDEAGGTT